MELINLFIARQYICYYSDNDFVPNKIIEREDTSDASLLDAVADVLSGLSLPKHTRINFILDQHYIQYHYLTFPVVSRKRIKKVLEFELVNDLLDEIEEYVFDYHLRINKERKETNVGVYILRKQWVESLGALCRNQSLEINKILSYTNLVDLNYRLEQHPQNGVFIYLNKFLARIFVYRNGFLSGMVAVEAPEAHQGALTESQLETFLALINRKINTVNLVENDLAEFALNPTGSNSVKITEKELLSVRVNEANNYPLPITIPKDLLTPTVTGHSQFASLLKTNILFLKELRKNRKIMIYSAVAAAACLVLHFSTVGYDSYRKMSYHDKLSQKYTMAISKYLPKGTSKTNALYILKEKVRVLKKKQDDNARYSVREYQTMTLLKKISLLKKEINSLKMKRFSVNEKSIALQGQVESNQDIDLLNKTLNTLFPPASNIVKTNQKTNGDSLVRFSTTIRSRKNG